MTENKSIFSTLNSVSSLLPVTLVDGSRSYDEEASSANATPSLSLSYILYIPKFPLNLLSVNL